MNLQSESAALLMVLLVLVLGLFTVAARTLWLGHLQLKREKKAILRLRSDAEAAGTDAGAVASAVREAVSADELRETAVAERVRLLDVAARRGTLPHRDGLTFVAEVAVETRLRVPRTIANLLVLLGLAGTLVGLTLAVWKLGDMPASDQELVADTDPRAGADSAGTLAEGEAEVVAEARRRMKQIEESLRGTLLGMRTAFVPALAAVAGTVLLLLGLGRTQAAQREVLADLERLTDELLVPAFAPEPQRVLSEAVTATVRAARELLNSAQEITAAARNAVSTASVSFDAATKSASTAFAAAVKDATEKLTAAGSAVRTEASHASNALSKDVADARANLEKAAENAGTRLERAAAADREPIRQAADTVQKTLVPSLRELDQRTSALTAFIERAEEVVARLGEVLEQEGEVVRSVADAGGVVTESLGQLTRSVTAEASARHELAESSGRLSAALENVERVRQSLSSMNASHDDLARTTSTVLAEHTGLVRQVADDIAALRKHADSAAPTTTTDGARGQASAPELVRVEIVDPRRHMDELRDVVVALIERQRKDDDVRWETVFQEHVQQWQELETKFYSRMLQNVEELVAAALARTAPAEGRARWWPGGGRKNEGAKGGVESEVG